MDILDSMQQILGKGRYFLRILKHRKGGTVVPPCDFHPLSPETPLNTGAPTIILSGARPPPRATRVRMQQEISPRENYSGNTPAAKR